MDQRVALRRPTVAVYGHQIEAGSVSKMMRSRKKAVFREARRHLSAYQTWMTLPAHKPLMKTHH